VEREMDIYRKKIQNDVDHPQSDWITLNLGGESFKTQLSVLLRDSSFFQLVFFELIEMQGREINYNNRIHYSELLIQGMKSDKENLEKVVAVISSQLTLEKEKRIKLEEEVSLMKSQLNDLIKSLHT